MPAPLRVLGGTLHLTSPHVAPKHLNAFLVMLHQLEVSCLSQIPCNHLRCSREPAQIIVGTIHEHEMFGINRLDWTVGCDLLLNAHAARCERGARDQRHANLRQHHAVRAGEVLNAEGLTGEVAGIGQPQSPRAQCLRTLFRGALFEGHQVTAGLEALVAPF
jgi:hypothetical protein